MTGSILLTHQIVQCSIVNCQLSRNPFCLIKITNPLISRVAVMNEYSLFKTDLVNKVSSTRNSRIIPKTDFYVEIEMIDLVVRR